LRTKHPGGIQQAAEAATPTYGIKSQKRPIFVAIRRLALLSFVRTIPMFPVRQVRPFSAASGLSPVASALLILTLLSPADSADFSEKLVPFFKF
jgi:hypothetical protein